MTPPSPYSPWAPWDASKRSFADALRSPLDANIGAGDAAPVVKIEAMATDDVAMPSDEATLAPPTLVLPGEEATLAPAANAAKAEVDAAVEEKGPFTFGDAFATGALPQAGASVDAAPQGSLFGAGVSAPTLPVESTTSLIAPINLESDEHSISMRTIKDPGSNA